MARKKSKVEVEIVYDDNGGIKYVKGFDKEFSKAAKGAGKFGSAASLSFGDVAKIAGVASVAIGAMAAVTIGAAKQVYELTRQIAEFEDDIKKTSERLGVSIELFSELRLAAQIGGTDVEKLGVGLRQLAKNAYDASNGTGEAKDAFIDLGISVRDASGEVRGQRELLLDIAESFSKMENGTKKTAIAARIFGRSGTDLINVLNMGREGIEKYADKARSLGIVLDEQTAAKAERLNDQLVVLDSAILGAKIQIGDVFIPVLTDLVESFTENDAAIATFREGVRKASEIVVSSSLVMLEGLTGALQIARQFEQFKTSIWASFAVNPTIPTGIQDVARKMLGVEVQDQATLDSIIALSEGIEDSLRVSLFRLVNPLEDQAERIKKVGDAAGGAATQIQKLGSVSLPSLAFPGTLFSSDAERQAQNLRNLMRELPRVEAPEVSFPQQNLPVGITPQGPDQAAMDQALSGFAFTPTQEQLQAGISAWATFAGEVSDILGGTYATAISGAGEAWNQFITGQAQGGEAFKRLATSLVAGVSQQMFQLSLTHLGMAIAALTNPWALSMYGPPPANFKAAGILAAAAAVSGGASRGLSGGGGAGGLGPAGTAFNPIHTRPGSTFDREIIIDRRPALAQPAQLSRSNDDAILGQLVQLNENLRGLSAAPAGSVVTKGLDERGGVLRVMHSDEVDQLGRRIFDSRYV